VAAGLQPSGFCIRRRNGDRRYAHEMLALVFDVATIEERFLASLGMTAPGGLQKWAGENQSGGIKPPLHSESKWDYFFASGGAG
jgi:hypothetical protein